MANVIRWVYGRTMAARVQLSLKIAPTGKEALERLGQRVAETGRPDPGVSVVARAAIAEAMGDAKVRDRVFARLLTLSD
jgi:hypothetical protein